MNTPVIGIDVDGVIADLHTAWLRMYNKEWDDDLQPHMITHWDIERFVKPECGERIFTYLRRSDLYSQVYPYAGSKSMIAQLREMPVRVAFVTSNVMGMTDQKWEWLIEHDFVERSYHMKDIVITGDKGLFAGDYLVDDSLKQAHNFWRGTFGGVAVVMARPWNLSPLSSFPSWQPIRVRTFDEAVKFFQERFAYL